MDYAPYFRLKICTIFGAPGKREKKTKFFFSLLNLSSFLCAVRRFLKESYTDIGLLPAYDKVAVLLLHTFGKLHHVKDSMHRFLGTPERGQTVQ